MKENEIKIYYKNYSLKFTNNTEYDLLNQVGKTYLGNTITKEIFNNIIKSIVFNLNILEKDEILDLCCANGLITKYISKYCKFVNGFDLSDDLINTANKVCSLDNNSFKTLNILDIDFNNYKSSKIYMYEALQFFDGKMLKDLLVRITSSKNTFSLFIGSIPNQEKIFEFYNTQERKKYYFNEVLNNGKFHIGNWWYKEQIQYLCEDLGLACKIIEQDKSLHTAHYRFDCLIEKK